MKPHVRNEILSPRVWSRAGDSETIGYLEGDLPSVGVQIDGEMYYLRRGQCVPCGGQSVQLFNPFSRTGRVAITRNFPVQSAFGDKLREHHVEYFVDKWIGGAGGNAGFGFTSFALPVKLDIYMQSAKFDIYHGVTGWQVQNRPAGFMPDTTNIRHVSGDYLSQTRAVSGTYTNALKATWIADVSYTSSPIARPPDWSVAPHFTSVIIEPGSAVFAYRESGSIGVEVVATELPPTGAEPIT